MTRQSSNNKQGTRHGRACPGHPRSSCSEPQRTWMPGTRPGMTAEDVAYSPARLAAFSNFFMTRSRLSLER
ncbi:hypothetical protein C7U89_20345 [Bradyrhizobium sp. WBOS4]|nr:hypothetical protein [Bradyrhizobium sp. WBOS8]MDD1585272.1 hypothetical protein [Bradyrhizobium sp. WBOS4]UUO45788.1 hypothetical protein DCM78_01865 [Bradyrhizobium sp. WBOS04]UUO59438.1 hypothetical protein DCM80_09780 [Bradyrhizobium sp. WBOS08]